MDMADFSGGSGILLKAGHGGVDFLVARGQLQGDSDRILEFQIFDLLDGKGRWLENVLQKGCGAA